ncbi:putative transposase family protein, partial [Escherichia coli 88.1042]
SSLNKISTATRCVIAGFCCL